MTTITRSEAGIQYRRTKANVCCPCCGKEREIRQDIIRMAQKKGRQLTCRSCASKEPKDHSGFNAGRFSKDPDHPINKALVLGLTRYQGKPCKHGHGTERYTKDSKCVVCVALRAARRTAAWSANNPGKRAAIDARRRAAKAFATPCWLTDDDFAAMQHIYEQAAAISLATGIKHEVDHIIPLQGENVCGLHCPANLRIVTRSENRRKCNKLIYETA